MTAQGEQRRLSLTIQEELYRIARELLLNTLQHAEAQRIETEIHYGEEMLHLRTRYDGIGIDLKV